MAKDTEPTATDLLEHAIGRLGEAAGHHRAAQGHHEVAQAHIQDENTLGAIVHTAAKWARRGLAVVALYEAGSAGRAALRRARATRSQGR